MARAEYDVEWLKLRRSRVARVAAAVLLLAPPGLAAAFVGAAARGGQDPMSVKAGAMLTGTGWEGYLDALVQVYATAGLLGTGIVAAWCFGREFVDRTVVSLYASATPRHRVAAAKLVVLAGWSVGVSLALVPVAAAVGVAVGLGPPDPAAVTGLGRLLVLAVLTALGGLAAALFASAGRGYLPAVGGLLGLVVAAQVAVVVGAGAWFPWSAPGLWAVSGTAPGLDPVPGWRLLLVPATTLLVGAGTVAWWRRAQLR